MRRTLAMPIRVRCACGKSLAAPETAAGKRLKCPGCGRMILVPEPDLLLDEPAAHAKRVPKKARHCPACQDEMLGDSSLCIACGWDIEQNARLCPQCRRPYRVSYTTGYTYSAGVVALSVGVRTALFGLAGGILGDVAWALAVGAGLGVLNCLSGLLSTAYACPMCHDHARARLSKKEAEATNRQKAIFGAGLAGCVVALLLMVGWYRSLRNQTRDVPSGDAQATDATAARTPIPVTPPKPGQSDTLLLPGADYALVNVDNPTPSPVQVAMDGELRWDVPPWGASSHAVPAGPHALRVESKGGEALERGFAAVEGKLYLCDVSGGARYVAWEEGYQRVSVETWGGGGSYLQYDNWGRLDSSTSSPTGVGDLTGGPWLELEANVPVGTEVPSGFQLPAEDPLLPGGKCRGYLRVVRRRAGARMSADEADALLSGPKAGHVLLPGWEDTALDAVAREIRTAKKYLLPELSISTNDERWRQREAARKAMQANASADWVPALVDLLAHPPEPYETIHPDAQRDIVEVVGRLGTPADLANVCRSLDPEVRKELLARSTQMPWATARGLVLAGLADAKTLDESLAALARPEAKGDGEVAATLATALDRGSALACARVIASGLLEGADLGRCCDRIAKAFEGMLDDYARQVSYVLGSAEALVAPEADGLLAAMAAYPRDEPRAAAARVSARRGAAIEARGDDAEALYTKALELHRGCEAAIDWFGMRAWMRGDFNEAWGRLQDANPINGAEDRFVTLHLWALLQRMAFDSKAYRDLAMKLAAKWRAARPGDGWADRILAYAAGEGSEGDLLKAAEDGPEEDRVTRRCQACFYIAYNRLGAGDVPGAKKMLADAIATKARVLEHAVAVKDISRIKK